MPSGQGGGAGERAVLGTSEQDYARFGLRRDAIERWEDGLRTHGGRGTYEWWYLDAHLEGGAKLVIVFYTKPLADVTSPLTPHVAVTLDRADGSHHERQGFWPRRRFSAARDRCDVRIADNHFEGDLHTYRVHVAIDDTVMDVTLTGTVPPWRPATGHLLFGPDGAREFAWLPSVPQGRCEADITIGGRRERLAGIGYHDHNWGNCSMPSLMHHWYWARGKVGDYTIIASHITAERRYGHQGVPVFLVARDGRILADDGARVEFGAAEVAIDGPTGKPVADLTRYVYRDGQQRFELTFRRRQTILRMKLVDTLPRWKRLLARLAGFDGSFLRFTGELRLERFEGDQRVEALTDEAIWELMHFGKALPGAAYGPWRAAAG